VVLRYVHDPVTEETLNWGVVLYSAEAQYLGWKVDRSGSRLAHAFRGFSKRLHRQVRARLDQSLSTLSQEAFGPQLSLFGSPKNAGSVMLTVWPDVGTQYRTGPVQDVLPASEWSVAERLPTMLDELYETYVAGQVPAPSRPSRADLAVWRPLAGELKRRGIADKWTTEKLTVADFQFEFRHAHRNGRLNLVEALSFDLSSADEIRDKSARWLGYGHLLKRSDELGEVLLLVGPPSRDRLCTAYRSALDLLGSLPLKVSLFEDPESARCAEEMERLTAHR
jgi:hypothetical protein